MTVSQTLTDSDAPNERAGPPSPAGGETMARRGLGHSQYHCWSCRCRRHCGPFPARLSKLPGGASGVADGRTLDFALILLNCHQARVVLAAVTLAYKDNETRNEASKNGRPRTGRMSPENSPAVESNETTPND